MIFKKITKFVVALVLMASLLSCIGVATKNSEDGEGSQGTVNFCLQGVNSANANILFSNYNEETPTKVVLKFHKIGTSEETTSSISLTPFGTSYITNKVLSLDEGDYELTRFDILNEQGITIYSTPMAGSKVATNTKISTPLGYNFSISTGVVKTVNMQVVEVEESTDPADFGFTAFTFEVVDYNKFYIKALALDKDNYWEDVTADLKVLNENAEKIKETKLQSNTNRIFVDKANNYTLTITKDGYSSQEFKFTQAELENYQDKSNPLKVKLTNMADILNRETLVMLIATGKDVSQLDVSGITDMSYLMVSVASYLGYEKGYECDVVKDFNQDISSWDVSNVTNMSQMFKFAYSFNQNINSWDVSNVKDMSGMFNYAYSFNQNIGSWDVSNVKNMNSMFYFATKFNTDISGWEVKNVTDMLGMFAYASAFNQKMDNWDVSSVKTMAHMFAHTTSFNQDISNWKNKLGNVENMSHMFWDTKAFDQDISSWDVSSVTDFSYFDSKASPSWTANEKPNFRINKEELVAMIAQGEDVTNVNVSGITDMSYLMDSVASYLGYEKGYECDVVKDFNQDISSWDVSNVTNMSQMFKFAYSFNQNINSWDVSNVKDMSGMFNYAYSFNQNIGSWDVSNVKNMNSMFCFATKFNTDISGWEVKNVTDMLGMFAYASAFNQKMDNWDVSSVKTMAHMFAHTTSFNQDIRNWKNKLGNVENMSHMFWYTKAFDQDISSWDVSSVTNFSYFDSKASPSWADNEKPKFGN